MSENSFRFPPGFGDSFNTSCHANCRPKTRLRFFARGFGIRSHVLSRRSPSQKLNSLSLFPPTKRVLLPALGFWPIIWLLSPPHLVMLSFRATILTTMSPSPSTRSQSVVGSWLSFWPGFVTSFNRQAEELTYIPYSSFNGQSLGPVNSNTEG